MPVPGSPPDRWMCPRCGNIIEEFTYFNLPRRVVRGSGGSLTQVECPMCRRPSPSIVWTVVEVAGTEDIV